MSLTDGLNQDKQNPREIYPDQQQEELKSCNDKKVRSTRALGRKKNFRPIILCLALTFLGLSYAHAQIEGSVSLGLEYTDNLFQLSDYDMDRWKNDHANLRFADTTDDLKLSTRIDLAYPLHYRWWTFTPSVTAKINQNLSNTDKYRTDSLLRFRVDRYYWSLTTLYGYYPYIYYRHYTDTGATDELQKYSYERNLYRAELVVRPIKKLTTFGNIRYEDLYYNQYFTEADGDRLTTELGLRYSFPSFSAQGTYSYRIYDNTGYTALDEDDGSYDSNIYRGVLRLKAMPISGESTKHQSWQPYLELVREDRFYQGDSSWYGGREYHIYNTTAGLNIKLNPKWNLSLDYLHIFRNVESPNASVLRLKEFSENRLSASVEYKF
jgi:hypothetical protein